MGTDAPTHNNEIERRETNNNINNQQSNSVMRIIGVLSHQPLVSFVSNPEVRSEGITQRRPSTGLGSIFLNLEDNEIFKDQVEVVDVPLISVGDEEVLRDQVAIGSVNDVVNIDNYLGKSSNHCAFGRRHKKTQNIAIIYYFTNVLGSPPQKEWTKKYGTISHFIKEFKIPKKKRRQAMSVLREVYKYKR